MVVDMFVCKECFSDVELRAYVDSNFMKTDVCDVCHKTGNLIDMSEVSSFFEDMLRLYEPAEDGFLVSDIIQNDWHIFKDKATADTILTEVLTGGSFSFDTNTAVNYTSNIIERVSIWDRLKTSVKEKSRFFTSMDEFAKYNYLSAGSKLSVGRKLYRSRITPDGQRKLKSDKMGCPPKEFATAGRANPLGIPYLYLSDTAKTTYFEVRALYLDRISVGTFEIKKELNLVDFVFDVNLFTMSQEEKPIEEVVIKKKVIDAISADLSKPLRRYDSEIEYVPTQLICEYCRDFADGICFESSLHKGGHNYVLFDPTSAKCIRVDSHEIKKIDIDRK